MNVQSLVYNEIGGFQFEIKYRRLYIETYQSEVLTQFYSSCVW